MIFAVNELPRARADKRSIVEWIHERSPRGAAAWLKAYDRAVKQLIERADSYAEAHENRDLELDVRQVLFKTRRGRIYRALFIFSLERPTYVGLSRLTQTAGWQSVSREGPKNVSSQR